MRPGDTWVVTMQLSGAATGTPTCSLLRNGVADGAVTVGLIAGGAGEYKLSAAIPSTGYVLSDTIELYATATVSGVTQSSVVARDYIDTKRVGSLNDAAALTDYQRQNVAVILPTSPPAGFVNAIAAGVWAALAASFTTANSIGAQLLAWATNGVPLPLVAPTGYGGSGSVSGGAYGFPVSAGSSATSISFTGLTSGVQAGTFTGRRLWHSASGELAVMTGHTVSGSTHTVTFASGSPFPLTLAANELVLPLPN